MESWIKFKLLYDNSFAPGLGGACAIGTNTGTPWHWSKHLKFRPSWLFHTGCFSLHSRQTAILPHVGTLNSAYWAFSYNVHSSKSFSCSIKFFRWKITLGLALGESWLLLAETQKNSDVYNSTKACFLGKAFLGKPATITFGENKDVNSWIKLRLTVDFTTILLRQPSEELVPWEQTLEHHGIDPNMLDSGHHDCSKKAVFLCTAFKLQSWAFSTFHTSFIWAAVLLLWNSFLGWPWANLALLPQRQGNNDVRCLLFPIAVGRLS